MNVMLSSFPLGWIQFQRGWRMITLRMNTAYKSPGTARISSTPQARYG